MNEELMNSPEARAGAIGEIILAARQLEAALRKLTGPTEVAGLHALTELLGSRLPEDARHKLHYAATIRNRAAHEDDFMLSAGELQHFRQTVEQLLNMLESLAPAAAGQADKKERSDAENTLDVAVEKELFARLSARLALLGYFPAAGCVYLLYTLLYTVFVQAHLVILTALYCCAAVLGIKGYFSQQDRGLLYVAGTALLFAYAATAVISCKAPVRKLPRWINFMPLLNVFYLIAAFLTKLQWGRFLCAAAGLGCMAGGIVLIVGKYYNYGAAALAGSWAFSIAAAVIWGKKREE